jgi:hypothetical protein
MIETMVRCVECGYDNNPQYRFCGMCGLTLRPVDEGGGISKSLMGDDKKPAPVATKPAISNSAAERAARSKKAEVPLSGPSFLGLDNASSGTDYLLEDEPSSGHGRMYIALVLLLAAAGFLFWRWQRQGFPWQNRANAVVTSSAPTAPQASSPAQPQSPGTSAANPPEQAAQQATAPGPEAVPVTKTPSATVTPAEDSSKASPAPTLEPTADTQKTNSGAAVTSESDAGKESTPNTTSATDNQQDDQTAQSQPAAAPVAPRPKASTRPAAAVSITRNQPEPAEDAKEALTTQGARYLYGEGVPQNCDLAQRSLLAAAARGSTRAQSMLGAMYATGHCATLNRPTAYRWFAKALHQDPSNTRISADLEALWREMTPEERQAATGAQ